jgi:hypothetical protein
MALLVTSLDQPGRQAALMDQHGSNKVVFSAHKPL